MEEDGNDFYGYLLLFLAFLFIFAWLFFFCWVLSFYQSQEPVHAEAWETLDCPGNDGYCIKFRWSAQGLHAAYSLRDVTALRCAWSPGTQGIISARLGYGHDVRGSCKDF